MEVNTLQKGKLLIYLKLYRMWKNNKNIMLYILIYIIDENINYQELCYFINYNKMKYIYYFCF